MNLVQFTESHIERYKNLFLCIKHISLTETEYVNDVI